MSRESGFYSHCLCCSLSRLLTTFSTQNFPVINIPAHGRKLAFLILLPCFSESRFQQLALPAPAPGRFSPLLRDISGTQQNLPQHKDPKTPCKGSGSATSCRSGLRTGCTSRSPCLPSKVLLLLFLFDINQLDKNNSQAAPQPHTHSVSSGQHGHSAGAHRTVGEHEGQAERKERKKEHNFPFLLKALVNPSSDAKVQQLVSGQHRAPPAASPLLQLHHAGMGRVHKRIDIADEIHGLCTPVCVDGNLGAPGTALRWSGRGAVPSAPLPLPEEFIPALAGPPQAHT